jgi:hypothetical protein
LEAEAGGYLVTCVGTMGHVRRRSRPFCVLPPVEFTRHRWQMQSRFSTIWIFLYLWGLSISTRSTLIFLFEIQKKKERKRSSLFFNVSSRSIGYGKSQLSIQSSMEPVMVSFSQAAILAVISKSLNFSRQITTDAISSTTIQEIFFSWTAALCSSFLFYLFLFRFICLRGIITRHYTSGWIWMTPLQLQRTIFFSMQFIYYTPTCCVRTRCVYIFSCQVCISKSWIVQLHYSYRERFCMPGVFDGSESKQEFRFWCIEYTRTILHAREWNRACHFRYTFNSAFRERAYRIDRISRDWPALTWANYI